MNSISETSVFNVLSKNVTNRAMGNTQPLGIIIAEAARADLAARCRMHQVDTSSQDIATANDDRIGCLLQMALTAATARSEPRETARLPAPAKTERALLRKIELGGAKPAAAKPSSAVVLNDLWGDDAQPLAIKTKSICATRYSCA